jgi:dephospho-CoA kinase
MLKKIAITGGIATGKTTLLKILKKLGFPALSCDEIVENLYKRKDIQEKMIELFGKKVLSKEGHINKKIILKKIIDSPSLKQKLEELLHPEVLREIMHFFEGLERRGERLVFVEVPLLFEVAWEKYFDEIWVISSSEETQRERIYKLREPELIKLLSFQIPLKEKEKRAHKIFSSEKSLAELERELKEILKEYSKAYIPLE